MPRSARPRAARPTFLAALLVGALALATTGCRASREPLYAESAIVGETLEVRVADAHVRGERVVIKAALRNRSGHAVAVDKSGLMLRLEDGRLLPGPQGFRARRPLTIGAGRERTVRLTFRASDLGDLSSARLIIGGVHDRPGSEPRTLGEIALSDEYAVPPAPRGHGRRAEPDDAPAAASAEDGEPERADTDEDDDTPAARDDDAPEEAWVIGGG